MIDLRIWLLMLVSGTLEWSTTAVVCMIALWFKNVGKRIVYLEIRTAMYRMFTDANHSTSP